MELNGYAKKLPAASPRGIMLSIVTTDGLSVEINQGCGVSVWGVIWILKSMAVECHLALRSFDFAQDAQGLL